MTRRPVVLSSFLLSVSVLVLGACDSDGGACADGMCERDERDQTSEPKAPPPPTFPCRPACEALVGGCGADDSGDATSIRAVTACIDWCEAGGLSADEAACIASVDCAGAGGCLAD